jgi:hypothetical protein
MTNKAAAAAAAEPVTAAALKTMIDFSQGKPGAHCPHCGKFADRWTASVAVQHAIDCTELRAAVTE